MGLWSKNALGDPRERKNKQKKAVQEVFAGLWNENGLRDPRKAGMETGTRAERADEGTSVGLGSRNALRDPSKQRKLGKVKRKKQIVGLWSKNGLRDPREKGTGGLWMWQ